MSHTYLRRSWINPKLEARESRIHGLGVFTKEPIAAGERLMEFGGELISREEAYSNKYRSRSVWPVGADQYLASPTSDTTGGLDEELNHSCNANAWLVDAVTLVARHTIDSGAEITLDQGTWNFEDASYVDNAAPCTCGAAECRHSLTDHDWKLSEVQVRYSGHFHPLVQQLIDAER